jgi:succinate-semialdehyde dehydrogenase/glutarate-semialdehyde dehydrogenase
MSAQSINPYTGEVMATYPYETEAQVADKLALLAEAYSAWRVQPVANRAACASKLGQLLTAHRESLARMAAQEMGKPIVEARAEIDKCVLACDYYAAHAAEFLATETQPLREGVSGYVMHSPICAVLQIMPWNYPYWQVIRATVPALLAGNVVLLKHAPNVWGCTRLLADLFAEAGFSGGVFQPLYVQPEQLAPVYAHPLVQGVALTGSTRAGRAVASLAGQHLKRQVLELGGSNALVVLADADLELAAAKAATGRFLNTGQSCVAVKRIIVEMAVYEAFLAKFLPKVQALRAGDPLDEATQIGVLARPDLADQLERQMQASLAAGAVLLVGGTRKGTFFAPTVLGGVLPGMPAFDEETFGPLAAITPAADAHTAMALAGHTPYGLGISVFTQNRELAWQLAQDAKDGAFFWNDFVKSDPKLPFGGTGESGYGRELGREGILAFTNTKSVVFPD